MKQTLRNLDSFHRHHGDHNKSIPRTHGSNNSYQADSKSSKWNNNFSPMLTKDHQQEEDRLNFHPNRKQSVLAKVKEKAKKWRQTLVKKKHGHEDNHTPSWGVALEDYENDDDPEYLGAPTYKSEHAPDGYKEQSRSGSMVTEKNNEKQMQKEDDMEKPRPIKTSTIEHGREEFHDPPSEIKEIQEEEEEDEKFSSSQMPMILQRTSLEGQETPLSSMKLVEEERGKTPSPSPEEGASETEEEEEEICDRNHKKTLAEAVAEKLAPAYATISGATQMVTSKVQELSMSGPLTVTPTSEEEEPDVVDDDDNEYGIAGENKWDKGVSVKEYLKNKLEPGEDERALSQVISEVMSPRRTPGDKGVMERVKEAVTSLLLVEQQQQEEEEEEEEEVEEQKQKQIQQWQQQQPQRNTPSTRWHSSSSSPQIPLSTNAYEAEEESHGRILQTN